MPQKFLARQLSRVPQKLPLHLILVVPFVLQMFAVVGLVGWLSLRNGQKAVSELATELQEETAARIEQHLTTYLATPQLINQINVDAVQRGELKIQSEQSKRYLWQQIQHFETISWIYYATQQDGEFIGVTRQGHNRELRLALNQKQNDYQTFYYTLDLETNRVEFLETDPDPYQPQSRPWYPVAANSNEASWSEIYPDFDTSQLVITASLPVYDDAGAIAGVVGVDLFLNDINQFLHSLHADKAGQTFIMERSGLLVASSTAEPLAENAEGQSERIQATESQNEFIRATAEHVNESFGSVEQIQSQTQMNFVLEDTSGQGSTGNRHFLRVTAFQDGKGLDWLIFVVVPESEFMSQIHANTRTTVMLCFVALLVAIALGTLTAQWIAQPILQLSEASKGLTKHVAQPDFVNQPLDAEVEINGADEIRILAKSFNQLSRQLQASFVALEGTNSELEVRVEQLKQVQLQLVQSEKMSTLGQLVSGVAHEINNPVNFIAGNLKYARRYTQELLKLLQLYQKHYPTPPLEIDAQIRAIDLDYVSEDLPKLLGSMTEGTNRICSISKSLRTFSRGDSIQVAVNIHEGLDSTLMILRHRLKENGQRCAIRVNRRYGSLPLVKCYPTQLNQVFMNIIANAIDAFDEPSAKNLKFSKSSPATITIYTKVADYEDKVIIGIEDNGPGMTEEVRSQIFDYLFTTKPLDKGTGLGLPISRQIIVEKHGGTITCLSASGLGTEFIIELPM
ncbi:HAMP domain-containing protein [Oculatella sp. FACHB-28]|uniref:ATP-binding protein n=1 Tax=Oculatella sp. FACHB-28 TaxID=2692845 RepID=UPI001686DFC1|nr:ATP-binding protein [Oculatella sp. FACHB-28]MBD2057777.1 HAMP domain-containing protein [Oculatella sp. FACHB-28]